jgi:hypothetical protein
MNNKFYEHKEVEIGDTVESNDPEWLGLKGVVVTFTTVLQEYALVDFGEGFSGHDGGGLSKNKNCLWIEVNKLPVLSEKVQFSENEYDALMNF